VPLVPGQLAPGDGGQWGWYSPWPDNPRREARGAEVQVTDPVLAARPTPAPINAFTPWDQPAAIPPQQPTGEVQAPQSYAQVVVTAPPELDNAWLAVIWQRGQDGWTTFGTNQRPAQPTTLPPDPPWSLRSWDRGQDGWIELNQFPPRVFVTGGWYKAWDQRAWDRGQDGQIAWPNPVPTRVTTAIDYRFWDQSAWRRGDDGQISFVPQPIVITTVFNPQAYPPFDQRKWDRGDDGWISRLTSVLPAQPPRLPLDPPWSQLPWLRGQDGWTELNQKPPTVFVTGGWFKAFDQRPWERGQDGFIGFGTAIRPAQPLPLPQDPNWSQRPWERGQDGEIYTILGEAQATPVGIAGMAWNMPFDQPVWTVIQCDWPAWMPYPVTQVTPPPPPSLIDSHDGLPKHRKKRFLPPALTEADLWARREQIRHQLDETPDPEPMDVDLKVNSAADAAKYTFKSWQGVGYFPNFRFPWTPPAWTPGGRDDREDEEIIINFITGLIDEDDD
jgi:hypothetical protein